MKNLLDLTKVKEKLKTFLKGGDKELNKIVMLAALGLMLIVLGNQFSSNKNKRQNDTTITYKDEEIVTTGAVAKDTDAYIKTLEKKVEDFLKNMSGVEDAKVMISQKYSKEYIVLKDTSINTDITDEKDASGGARAINSSQSEETTIFSGDSPFIVKQKEPTIKGAVILIRGNVDVRLVSEVKEVLKVYLELPINRIQVYEMKNRG